MAGTAADASAIRGTGDTRVAIEPHNLMPRRKNSASDQQPWDCLRCRSGGGQRADAKCPMAVGGRHLIRRQTSQSSDQPDEDALNSCHPLALQSTLLSLARKYPGDMVLEGGRELQGLSSRDGHVRSGSCGGPHLPSPPRFSLAWSVFRLAVAAGTAPLRRDHP